MIKEEFEIWIILLFMWLLVPEIARPFSGRGWTKVLHHLKKGRPLAIAHLYAHSCKGVVLVLSYYATGLFSAVVLPFALSTGEGFSWSWLTPFFG